LALLSLLAPLALLRRLTIVAALRPLPGLSLLTRLGLLADLRPSRCLAIPRALITQVAGEGLNLAPKALYSFERFFGALLLSLQSLLSLVDPLIKTVHVCAHGLLY